MQIDAANGGDWIHRLRLVYDKRLLIVSVGRDELFAVRNSDENRRNVHLTSDYMLRIRHKVKLILNSIN